MTDTEAEAGRLIRRRWEIELSISQAEVSRRSGLSDTTIREFEDGKGAKSRRPTRVRLSRALDWDENAIDRLLEGKKPTKAWNEPWVDDAPPDDPDVRAELAEVKGLLRRILERLPAEGD